MVLYALKAFETQETHPEVYCPVEVIHVYDWFRELMDTYGSNGFGISPLGPANIEAWARLTGVRIKPHEAKMLFRLDLIYRGHVSKPNKSRQIPVDDIEAQRAMWGIKRKPDGR